MDKDMLDMWDKEQIRHVEYAEYIGYIHVRLVGYVEVWEPGIIDENR